MNKNKKELFYKKKLELIEIVLRLSQISRESKLEMIQQVSQVDEQGLEIISAMVGKGIDKQLSEKNPFYRFFYESRSGNKK